VNENLESNTSQPAPVVPAALANSMPTEADLAKQGPAPEVDQSLITPVTLENGTQAFEVEVSGEKMQFTDPKEAEMFAISEMEGERNQDFERSGPSGAIQKGLDAITAGHGVQAMAAGAIAMHAAPGVAAELDGVDNADLGGPETQVPVTVETETVDAVEADDLPDPLLANIHDPQVLREVLEAHIDAVIPLLVAENVDRLKAEFPEDIGFAEGFVAEVGVKFHLEDHDLLKGIKGEYIDQIIEESRGDIDVVNQMLQELRNQASGIEEGLVIPESITDIRPTIEATLLAPEVQAPEPLPATIENIPQGEVLENVLRAHFANASSVMIGENMEALRENLPGIAAAAPDFIIEALAKLYEKTNGDVQKLEAASLEMIITASGGNVEIINEMFQDARQSMVNYAAMNEVSIHIPEQLTDVRHAYAEEMGWDKSVAEAAIASDLGLSADASKLTINSSNLTVNFGEVYDSERPMDEQMREFISANSHEIGELPKSIVLEEGMGPMFIEGKDGSISVVVTSEDLKIIAFTASEATMADLLDVSVERDGQDVSAKMSIMTKDGSGLNGIDGIVQELTERGDMPQVELRGAAPDIVESVSPANPDIVEAATASTHEPPNTPEQHGSTPAPTTEVPDVVPDSLKPMVSEDRIEAKETGQQMAERGVSEREYKGEPPTPSATPGQAKQEEIMMA